MIPAPEEDASKPAERDSTRPQGTPEREIQSVAVIGAGLSGLICAGELASHGFRVEVFEKSRGVGGRMATRRTDQGMQFDHGAQYFTVRDPQFEPWVDRWAKRGLVARWPVDVRVIGRTERGDNEPAPTRYVGVPSMNAPCKDLAGHLTVHCQVRVQRIFEQLGQWRLQSDAPQTLGNFDAVVVTTPAQQAAELLRSTHQLPRLVERIEAVRMEGCWAALLGFQKPLAMPFDAAFVHQSPLSWIARNTSKPGRPRQSDCWVLHAEAEWSERHLDRDADEVLPELLAAFASAVDTPLQKLAPDYATAHRWRYAKPVEPLDERMLSVPEQRVVVCGDWCGGPRVEGAALSGLAAAREIYRWNSGGSLRPAVR